MAYTGIFPLPTILSSFPQLQPATGSQRDSTSEFRPPASICVEKPHPRISGSIAAPTVDELANRRAGGPVGGRAGESEFPR